MRKTKKQLLGIAGLAAVGVMTAVAYAMPAPDAAAVSGNTNGYECDNSQPGNECASTDGGATVNVTVIPDPETPSVTTSSPKDGSTLIDPEVKITTSYSKVLRIDYVLSYRNLDGTTHEVSLDSYTPDKESGIHEFATNIAQYGYGEYTLRTTAHGYNGVTREDNLTFNYRAILANFEEKSADNNDPILKVNSNSDVEKLIVSVYNKAGEPLLVDESGKEVPIVVERKDIDPATGEILITLPFEQYSAPAGEYTAVVIARNADDKTISMATANVSYQPIAPDTPNTGSGLLADLNITRIDYLLTGLIAFGLVSGFALYLVCRKNRR